MVAALEKALHQERSELLLAVSGNRVSADMGWQILHRWDALVEIAKAARESRPPECPDEGCLHPTCNLARALAVLDNREETWMGRCGFKWNAPYVHAPPSKEVTSLEQECVLARGHKGQHRSLSNVTKAQNPQAGEPRD